MWREWTNKAITYWDTAKNQILDLRNGSAILEKHEDDHFWSNNNYQSIKK